MFFLKVLLILVSKLISHRVETYLIVDDDNWEKNILFAVIDKYIDKDATCATFFIQFILVNNKIHRQKCHSRVILEHVIFT